MESIISQAKQLIQQGRTQGALELLQQQQDQLSSDQVNLLIQLSGRQSRLDRSRNMGIIAFNDAQVEQANIINGLLGFLSELKSTPAQPVSPTGTSTATHSPTPVDPTSPTPTKILFLAANPTNTGRLRLDQEHREITEGLARASKRDQFDLVTRLAVRPRDLQLAMVEESPRIVHFSGHGLPLTGEASNEAAPGSRQLSWEQEADVAPAYQGGIALEGSDGKAHIVKAEALGTLFELFSGQVDCVVLNACYSELQGEALQPHVRYIVGMNTAVPDATAIAFATSFYDALGAGRDLPFAFKMARNAIQLSNLPGADIPVLIEGNKPLG